VETVKEIIVNLARDIRETRAGNKRESDWQSIPIEHFLRKDGTVKSVSEAGGVFGFPGLNLFTEQYSVQTAV